MKGSLATLALLFASMSLNAQTPAAPSGPLTRHYQKGETLNYHMSATNDDRRYTADVSCVTEKTEGGSYAEECRWTSAVFDGQAVTLAPEMVQFRESVSLDPSWIPSAPDPAKADPRMVGPILDLFTLYTDLWLTNKSGALQHPGDHIYLPNPQVGSWADGTRVLVGKSHVDFDLSLQSIDPLKHSAVVLVHHVPPAHPNLQFPAAWMQTPVAETPNNWVQVTKSKEGKYEAGAGRETFDDSFTVSTDDGRILSATMDNPVVMSGRECNDSALTVCGEAYQHTIHRYIEITLAR